MTIENVVNIRQDEETCRIILTLYESAEIGIKLDYYDREGNKHPNDITILDCATIEVE